jgi:hypothetical protein
MLNSVKYVAMNQPGSILVGRECDTMIVAYIMPEMKTVLVR